MPAPTATLAATAWPAGSPARATAGDASCHRRGRDQTPPATPHASQSPPRSWPHSTPSVASGAARWARSGGRRQAPSVPLLRMARPLSPAPGGRGRLPRCPAAPPAPPAPATRADHHTQGQARPAYHMGGTIRPRAHPPPRRPGAAPQGKAVTTPPADRNDGNPSPPSEHTAPPGRSPEPGRPRTSAAARGWPRSAGTHCNGGAPGQCPSTPSCLRTPTCG